MTVIGLYFSFGAHHDAATAGLISLLDALQTIYIGTCGEIGSRDILHQTLGVYIWIVDVCTAAVDDFAQIMCGDIGCHTYGNTVTAIDEQIGYLGGHNRRFDEGVVKVVGHVYRVLVQVIHHVLTHFGKAALGITHSCRRVAVYATKVTLTINELIAHIPFLAHSDEGAID